MEEIVKKDIRALDKEALRTFFVTQGQSAFRGNQVYEWLWQKGVHSFESMTNISKETRAFLETHFVINHIMLPNRSSAQRVIMRPGRNWARIDFATLQICKFTAFEAIRRGQMDVSEPRNLCSRTRVKDNDS